MMTNRCNAFLATLAVSAATVAMTGSAKAVDYPIDCAILLCMAGGWPGQGDCIPARAEFIRRISKIPPEPPLQIWRCPMNASAGGGSSQGAAANQSPMDPTTRELLNQIKVYHVQRYSKRRNRDDNCIENINIQLGSYDATGAFGWRRISEYQTPEWATPGVSRSGCHGNFRGVGLRWTDEKGVQDTHVVRY